MKKYIPIIALAILVSCAGTTAEAWKGFCSQLPLANAWLQGFGPIAVAEGKGEEFAKLQGVSATLAAQCAMELPEDPVALATAVSGQIAAVYLFVKGMK